MFKAQQILFWHFNERKYMPGILLGDTVICACCGECLHQRQIEKSTPEDKKPIIYMKFWKPFNDYIEVLKLNPPDPKDKKDEKIEDKEIENNT